MEKLYKQLEVLVIKCENRFKNDEFFTARIKLTFFYSTTAIIILLSSSFVLYKLLLMNLGEYIMDSRIDPFIARKIMDQTRDILLSRFILVDSLIMFFVILIGFLLTQKTLKPISENMQKQKRFIADASHELRTPVAVVVSGLEVALRNKNLNLVSAKQTLENTLEEMKGFSKLTNNLLDISKYDNDTKIEHSRIAIDEFVKDICLKMNNIAIDKKIIFKFESETKCTINGDKIELSRVIYNIIDNAITHTKEGGLINVVGVVKNNMYILSIKDNGSGIEKSLLKKVFEPFFRSDASRSTEGAGLGLTLSKKIIENHKGSINLKSELNKGTEVTISLPLSSS